MKIQTDNTDLFYLKPNGGDLVKVPDGLEKFIKIVQSTNMHWSINELKSLLKSLNEEYNPDYWVDEQDGSWTTVMLACNCNLLSQGPSEAVALLNAEGKMAWDFLEPMGREDIARRAPPDFNSGWLWEYNLHVVSEPERRDYD